MKILLATSAIIGAVGLASSAMAGAPRVTVGGFVDFQAVHADNDLTGATSNDYGFRNDTEVHLNIDGVTDGGLGYGAVIELEADVTGDLTSSGVNSDRTYIYLDGDWGRFEMGSMVGAEKTMKVDASSIARATGGIDGDWFRFVNVGAGNYIARPDLPVAHGGFLADGETENAGKITYYSRNMEGFQFGISYTPHTNARGQDTFGATSGAAGLGAGYEDVFSGGISFHRAMDGFDLGLSATGETGDGQTRNLRSWALGTSLGFGDFNVAGSWANTKGNFGDGRYWTLGAAYAVDAFGISATYMESRIDNMAGTGRNNKLQNLSFGADYAMAPGMTPYMELSFVDLDGDTDQDGTVFIVGTQLAF